MDQEALINAMTSKGHTRDTAMAAIAGRGYEDLAREYLGTTSTGGGTSSDRYMGGINPEDVPSTLDYINKLSEVEDTALNDLVMAMKARKSPLDVYTQLEEAAGLPALRGAATTLSKEIGGIEDTLETIEPDVMARSRESLLTEAQRRGVVGARKEPYLEKLSKFTTNLGRIGQLIGLTSGEIGTKAGLYAQGEEMKMEPLKLRYQALVDRNARLISGFTDDKQTKLEILMDKIRRQRELSDQDWQLANELSAEKREYTKQLQTAAAGAGYKVTGQESDDELLGIIGTKAAEKIAWERKGTATEKKATTAKNAANDAAAGMTLRDLQTKYAGKLDTDEIVNIYTGSSTYGEPQEAYAKEILGIREKETSEDKAYKDYLLYKSAGMDDASARLISGYNK